MVVIKLAVFTCVFYLVASIVLEAVLIVGTRLLGGIMLLGTPWAWYVVFAPIWALSLGLACLVVRRGGPPGH